MHSRKASLKVTWHTSSPTANRSTGKQRPLRRKKFLVLNTTNNVWWCGLVGKKEIQSDSRPLWKAKVHSKTVSVPKNKFGQTKFSTIGSKNKNSKKRKNKLNVRDITKQAIKFSNSKESIAIYGRNRACRHLQKKQQGGQEILSVNHVSCLTKKKFCHWFILSLYLIENILSSVAHQIERTIRHSQHVMVHHVLPWSIVSTIEWQ